MPDRRSAFSPLQTREVIGLKIMIMGFSGSGKSTLCRALSQAYHVPALHLDRVQFLPGWQERAKEEQQSIVSDFMNRNRDGWVIDGNYSDLCQERRIQEADIIILMLFGRFHCLRRVFKRYRLYRGTSRPDMADGCNEKLDAAFVRWILLDSRAKKYRDRYRAIRDSFPEKVVILKNQHQIDDFMNSQGYRKPD